MSHADHRFWTDDRYERFRDVARTFEQGITITHPSRVKGECSHICGRCVWPATTVTYYEYRGERV